MIYDPKEYTNIRTIVGDLHDLRPDDVVLSVTKLVTPEHESSGHYDHNNNYITTQVPLGCREEPVFIVGTARTAYENEELTRLRKKESERVPKIIKLEKDLRESDKKYGKLLEDHDEKDRIQNRLRDDYARSQDKALELERRVHVYEKDIDKLRKHFGEKAMNEVLNDEK